MRASAQLLARRFKADIYGQNRKIHILSAELQGPAFRKKT